MTLLARDAASLAIALCAGGEDMGEMWRQLARACEGGGAVTHITPPAEVLQVRWAWLGFSAPAALLRIAAAWALGAATLEAQAPKPACPPAMQRRWYRTPWRQTQCATSAAA